MGTKLISISSQKGGVGKSTFTTLLASILYYEKGFNVAVIDCDYPQFSIKKQREREKKQIMSIASFNQMAQSQFERLQKKPYPVFSCESPDILGFAEEVLNKSSVTYDYIFFDFPGTVNSEHIVKAIKGMDYLFIPMEAERKVMESTLEFAFTLSELFKKSGKSDNIYLFWNKVDKREKNNLYEKYDIEVIKPLKLRVMEHYFPASSKFKKEIEEDARFVFNSTFFPAMKAATKGTSINLEGFTEELLTYIDSTYDKRGLQEKVLEEAV
ncbi:ParA family protein [Massilibacteroides vaginae]|uniref:ParA family protein n=1 Tax=Massilibacteroides vaginae TaxID=1673718 RepID=UPI000A1CD496|nr:ParA family protein [Massilibacteroides vaginae]